MSSINLGSKAFTYSNFPKTNSEDKPTILTYCLSIIVLLGSIALLTVGILGIQKRIPLPDDLSRLGFAKLAVFSAAGVIIGGGWVGFNIYESYELYKKKQVANKSSDQEQAKAPAIRTKGFFGTRFFRPKIIG